jgi:hypothetical protein
MHVVHVVFSKLFTDPLHAMIPSQMVGTRAYKLLTLIE